LKGKRAQGTQLTISSNAMTTMINEYTSEAGLRNLEREIARFAARWPAKSPKAKKGPFTITRGNLEKYLGVPKFYPELDQEASQVGLSTGLAWTQAGGEVLYVEAS
jgi:ATP-dependent Lon protease